MQTRAHDASIDWTFDGTWPHAPRWFDTEDGRMGFVDEGPRDGRPVVLVHGNPTWGYLYRDFIGPLVSAGHRVIVPDHLGFGRSDMPSLPGSCSIAGHSRRLSALLDALDLREVTVVPHDWGGPIALAWATRNAERVRSLVILNSFAHRPRSAVAMALPLRLCRAPLIGECLVKGLHMIARGFLFGDGITNHARLTPRVRSAYLAPHRTWASRTASLALARQFPSGPEGEVADFVADVERGLAALSSRPVLIAWAGRDVVFGEAALERWRADFPRAELLRVPDAGHFLQEDAADRVVPALLAFLAQ